MRRGISRPHATAEYAAACSRQEDRRDSNPRRCVPVTLGLRPAALRARDRQRYMHSALAAKLRSSRTAPAGRRRRGKAIGRGRRESRVLLPGRHARRPPGTLRAHRILLPNATAAGRKAERPTRLAAQVGRRFDRSSDRRGTGAYGAAPPRIPALCVCAASKSLPRVKSMIPAAAEGAIMAAPATPTRPSSLADHVTGHRRGANARDRISDPCAVHPHTSVPPACAAGRTPRLSPSRRCCRQAMPCAS